MRHRCRSSPPRCRYAIDDPDIARVVIGDIGGVGGGVDRDVEVTATGTAHSPETTKATTATDYPLNLSRAHRDLPSKWVVGLFISLLPSRKRPTGNSRPPSRSGAQQHQSHEPTSPRVPLCPVPSSAQWAVESLCRGWSVQVAAARVMAGAEQTGPAFFKDMAVSGLRFNAMIDRVAGGLATCHPPKSPARAL